MDWKFLLHQMVCGAIAAAGFGVLFNIRWSQLLWCCVTGALAVLVRTVCLGYGWSLEGASFLAALVVGSTVQWLRARTNHSESALDVAGCIPMVPGSFAAKAILGLFALTVTNPLGEDRTPTLIAAVENTLRVTFTIGAIGTGLAIPTLLLRVRVRK